MQGCEGNTQILHASWPFASLPPQEPSLCTNDTREHSHLLFASQGDIFPVPSSALSQGAYTPHIYKTSLPLPHQSSPHAQQHSAPPAAWSAVAPWQLTAALAQGLLASLYLCKTEGICFIGVYLSFFWNL